MNIKNQHRKDIARLSAFVFVIVCGIQFHASAQETKIDPVEEVLLRPRETTFARFLEQTNARSEMMRALSEFQDASIEARRAFRTLPDSMRTLSWEDRDLVKTGLWSAKAKVNFHSYEAAAQRAMDAFTKFYNTKEKVAEAYAQAFEVEPGVRIPQRGWSHEDFVGRRFQARFMAALEGGYKNVPYDFIDHLNRVEPEMKTISENRLDYNGKTKVLTAQGALDEQLNRMVRTEKEGTSLPARYLMRAEEKWGKRLSKTIADLNTKRTRAGGSGGLVVATGVTAALLSVSGVVSAGEAASAVDEAASGAEFTRAWARQPRTRTWEQPRRTSR